ncbi:MAG: tripartite tricarboxylate transporter TctB family protein [Hyphomicrobiaceae bacterium]
MSTTFRRRVFPYTLGLAAAVVLFHYANTIDYTPRASELGPDVWPKFAIGLMALVCIFKIVRGFAGARATRAIAELLEEQDKTGRERLPRYRHLLMGGIAAVVAFALLVQSLGFLLATLLFMIAFMYIGGYRNHLAIWSVGAAAMPLIGFLFLRFAYVSLPRGVPPFDRFTDAIRVLVDRIADTVLVLADRIVDAVRILVGG